MPKENKHARGRRGEKRKRNEDDEKQQSKRQKSTDLAETQYVKTDDFNNVPDDLAIFPADEDKFANERPFYGLLDDSDQEYFTEMDRLLELNDFPSKEERNLFLEKVYKQAEGKELKIANSQSCSRLLERLIQLSTPKQKKKLFGVFSGNFLYLVQHRFASHCCETLFIYSALVVTEELLGEVEIGENGEGGDGEDKTYVSMENLFLYALNELEGHMTFLLTDRFASHVLRVLLVVLSGQPLGNTSTRSLLQSKQKEKIGITGFEAKLSLEKRTMPESFKFSIQKIIADTVTDIDSTFIHVLATHPTGNPTLQLLLELELTQPSKKKDQKTILHTLLPDDPNIEDSNSAAFINGLIYDTLGSRLLETIVRFAPGKFFKSIYRSTFRERIGALSRNEIASFVVIRVLERLSKEDLEAAVVDILSQIQGLVDRNRTSVIKTLFERCYARNAIESIATLTTAVFEAYGSSPTTLLLKMTSLTSESLAPGNKARPDPATIHGSLLAQTLISISGPPNTLIQTALLALPSLILLNLALTTSTSHILQNAFTLPLSTSSAISADPLLTFRRKLANHLLFSQDQNQSQDPILMLATSPPGTHVLDALFTFTSSHSSLMSLKERITSTLVSYETVLRDDFSGRIVWRNWMCELFRRRKGDWVAKVRSNSTLNTKPLPANGQQRGQTMKNKKDLEIETKIKSIGDSGNTKTPIELAREKFAAAKIKKDTRGRGFGRATGANTV